MPRHPQVSFGSKMDGIMVWEALGGLGAWFWKCHPITYTSGTVGWMYGCFFVFCARSAGGNLPCGIFPKWLRDVAGHSNSLWLFGCYF